MNKKKIDINQYIRPCCRNFEPYVAGKPIETIKRELGLKNVIKLASNENPIGPSSKAVKAIKNTANNVFFYPDSNSWKLRKAVSKKFRIDISSILLGSGSDEIIELLAKAFFMPQDEIVVSEHAFIRYKMAGDLLDSTVVTIPMENYTHNLKAMFKAINEKTKAVFIANPNNPTGTYNDTGEMEEFLKNISELSCERKPLVIMDEAYYEYARSFKDYPETLKYIADYPNLIILRTFSKIYGLAGLRVGYGFTSRDIVDYIERIRPPFNITSISQEAAVASLNDLSQVKKSVRMVNEQRDFLYNELKKINLMYIPSAANFILIDVAPKAGQDVFREMLKEGVIVRAMDEYNLPNHVRVSIGLPKQNRFFITKLKKVLNRKRG
ncbi:MAG: histidinol-phosphate transaminase [Endomicrobiales bacterium]|nr:histidinol-phosphate transaminase [Endomicrobiales bacterium]